MSTVNSKIKQLLKKLPSTPGIYFFYNSQKQIIYIGKATNLHTRVKSYFQAKKTDRPIETMISKINNIKFLQTDSVLEAIILEAQQIKKLQPIYNVLGKDNKSWIYIVITNHQYPRVETIREHELNQLSEITKKKVYNKIFGPFPNLRTKDTIRILQKLFSISFCHPDQKKACFYRQLNQCLGVCTNEISDKDYKSKVINPLIQFLSGKKSSVIQKLKKQMFQTSKAENFEEAGRIRNQINNLKHIQDVTLIDEKFFQSYRADSNQHLFKIEGYDISNLGSTGKVGSLVVFDQSGPIKSEYKKFKIKTVSGQSDVDCLAEIFERRLKHQNWTLPDYFLVDGGKPQLNKIKKILISKNIDIPIIGIAKGQERKKNEFHLTTRNQSILDFIKQNSKLLIQVRDEAHRFAISYQRKLRKIKK
ncbi:hypothetical protein A2223_02820 [Candidatus Falkowbacteria bacterium RIFOXYA2_FULL_35_8]|uniref:Excinuclease ABC subunit C n=1 Tax=Candidatus Falkowbacteria bacterium RIFOXYC2_FULL_36_12 TaxID=1798002 RepID=A0A1F5SWX2_9BACT|nr:MAG: hypothetical protein A2478_01020 [Candidatus Falkowbacteria bacterium RIFOXYC2_FULL_36_12]OGF34434.1 MAG: hypothetical protein A2223_02820 [Candidatus Falkowbacteria bacterium RIFOXYA2_FULL_35_8]